MSATQTLLQRLRALSGYEHSDFSVGAEAADEIERLQAELAAAPVQPEPVLAQPKREPLTDDDITRLAESEGWHIWYEDVLREALSFGHAVVRLTLGEQG